MEKHKCTCLLISHTRVRCNAAIHCLGSPQFVLISHTRVRCNIFFFGVEATHLRSHFTHTRELQRLYNGRADIRTNSHFTHTRELQRQKLCKLHSTAIQFFVAFAHTFCMKWRSRHLWSAIFGANPSAFLCTHIVRTQLVNTNLGSA